MDDAGGVHGLERTCDREAGAHEEGAGIGGDRLGDRAVEALREPLERGFASAPGIDAGARAADYVGQREPVDPLHGVGHDGAFVDDVVDLDDVRVAHARHGPGFAQEARPRPRLVGRERVVLLFREVASASSQAPQEPHQSNPVVPLKENWVDVRVEVDGENSDPLGG